MCIRSRWFGSQITWITIGTDPKNCLFTRFESWFTSVNFLSVTFEVNFRSASTIDFLNQKGTVHYIIDLFDHLQCALRIRRDVLLTESQRTKEVFLIFIVTVKKN